VPNATAGSAVHRVTNPCVAQGRSGVHADDATGTRATNARSVSRQRRPAGLGHARLVDTFTERIVEKFVLASSGFERALRRVAPGQWGRPTPCAEWNVRDLVNHVTRGNANYVGLLNGNTAADFLRLRNADALGADPVHAFTDSVQACAAAFSEPGALEQHLDYPLGRAPGAQLLAVRTADTVIHTWDLARATNTDDALDPTLVSWITENLTSIYAGLAETPTAPDTTHRFFAAAVDATGRAASDQDRLLHRMGRDPHAR
jgi:uncharacterized protein (TIGR03086 family)